MKFLKYISLYTFVGFFGAGINFFMLPILSFHLTPADYGLISLFTSYVTILMPLVGLVAYSLLSVEYFRTKDKEEFASKFSSIQFIPVIPFLLLAVLSWFFFYSVDDLLELNNIHRIWGVVIICLAFAIIYIETLFNFLILQKKVGFYTIATVIKVIVELLITIWFVIYKKYGWEGRILAWCITSFIFLVVSFIYFKQQGFLQGKIKWLFMKEGIIFGLPLILHTIGKFVINQSDRIFIAKMISIDAVGLYNIGYVIGTVILIVITAFFNFYTPFLMERLSDFNEERKLQIVKINYFFIMGVIFLLLAIKVITPFIFKYFIDPRYHSGAEYVFWVGLSYCFWGGYLLFTTYISYFKRTRILGWLAVVNVILNGIFNYWLILSYGAIGAAYATALSFLIVLIIVAYQSSKIISLPWFQFKKVMRVKL